MYIHGDDRQTDGQADKQREGEREGETDRQTGRQTELEMPRPIFDYLWRHESYQVPLLSYRMSDITSFRETRRRGKHML